MSEANPEYFKSINEWRNWLEKNHQKEKYVWIIIQKKASMKQGIRYEETVLEAVAYGWIDGKMKRLNDSEFKQRFTPRRRNSIWSLSNRKRAEKLIRDGTMTSAGLKSIEEAKHNGRWANAYSSKEVFEIPDDLVDALTENQVAFINFNAFPPYAKFMYVHWINDAKRMSTRKRRILSVVERAENNLKLGIDLRISKSLK